MFLYFAKNYPPPLSKYEHITRRFPGLALGDFYRADVKSHYPSPSAKANSSCGEGFASTFLRSSFAFHLPKRVKSFWIPSAYPTSAARREAVP